MNLTTSADMRAFAIVVELGSFAKAAGALNVTPSALSKLVSRLEDRLGVRLLTRTTRRLALTTEGSLYLERAHEVLDLIERTEADVAALRKRPKGLLKINASTGFSQQTLLHALPEFLARYSEVTIDLSVTDRLVDPVSEHVDVIIRGSHIPNPDLVARELARGRRLICAAPSYIDRYGLPLSASDLARHNCLSLSVQSPATTWPLETDNGVVQISPRGSFSSDSVGMLFEMAVQGHGIVRLADFVVGKAIDDGKLIEILSDLNRSSEVSLWALMAKGRFRSPRVQAFLDFLASYLSK